MNSCLKVINLKKNFHTIKGEIKAIENISFEIAPGEIIGIVGSSGCGKSTLLNILAGLEQKTDGIINSDNLKISYMLQSDALLPWLNVLENATIGLKIQNKLNKENIDYVKNLIESFGLKDFTYEIPKNLSGGMKQRVACI